MASHTYDTSALILSRSSWGEGSVLLTALTERFGLVRAVGRAAREERSKMRGHLQPLTLLRLTLIRGGDVWRVTGTQDASLLGFSLTVHARELLMRITALVQRLLQGEEENERLFAHMRATLALIAEPLSPQEYDALEVITVLRILESLGYKSAEMALAPLIHEPLDRTLLSRSYPLRKNAIRAINATLRETQL